MQVDLFMELAAPAYSGKTDAVVFDEALAVARCADRCGYGAVWFAEHHFLQEYSLSSAPDMILAAIARETERLKLGFGILPLPIHDMVRVAERLATLDLLSDGRVLWGAGRGVTATELDGFGVRPGDTRTLFAERLAMLRHLLETGILNKEGTEYALQPRSRPELAAGWMAAVSPESFDLAAELGLDVMAGPFKPWPLVKADLARYRKRRPDGKTSFTLGVYCAEDHDAARRRAERGLVWAYRKILELTRPLMQGQLESYEHYRNLGWLTPLFDKVLNLSLLETMGLAAVGDPAHVGRKLTQLAESGLDRVSLVIGGGDLAASESVACVEMLGETVLPQIAGSAQTLKAVGI